MPGISYAKIIADCELLSASLKPKLPEMPHLQEESDALDVLIAETKELAKEQEDLKGRLREATRLRQEAERRGRDLRSRVTAQLQGKLGFTNENLIAFGIIPRKRTRKKAQKPTEVPPPAVPPVSSAAVGETGDE